VDRARFESPRQAALRLASAEQNADSLGHIGWRQIDSFGRSNAFACFASDRSLEAVRSVEDGLGGRISEELPVGCWHPVAGISMGEV
jgi:hypothetical protein